MRAALAVLLCCLSLATAHGPAHGQDKGAKKPRHDMSVRAFRAEAPEKEAVLTLDCQLDDRFPIGWDDLRENQYSIRLREPGTTDTIFALAAKGKKEGKDAFAALKDGKVHRLTVGLCALRKLGGAPVGGWAVIQRVLTESEAVQPAAAAAAPAKAKEPKRVGDDARSYFILLYGEPTKKGTVAAGKILKDSPAMFLTYGDKSVRVILRPIDPNRPVDGQTKWRLSHFTSSVNGAKLTAELAAGRLAGRMMRNEDELTEPLDDVGPFLIPPPFRGVPAAPKK